MSVKLLLYCTKAKPYLSKEIIDPPFIENEFCLNARQNINHNRVLNGKIVAECECEKVTEFDLYGNHLGYAINLMPILKQSCLNKEDMKNYLGDKKGYALHLSNVKVLNNPLQFEKDFIYKDYKSNRLITKAPQNMCNVYDRFGNQYVLISIRPEHLCKILNGEKTIEVRKKILNSMKEML